MSQVEIRDGQPYWYLSPDIWAVPGNDPNAAPGTPIAGQPAFVWAHVANRGSTQADGVRINFWWADPMGQVLRSTANPIGTAFADLAPAGQPGSEQDVLCLAPWPVTLVNGGHECLVAEAIYPGSSVPTPAPDAFNPPAYVEIAQKNLTVLAAMVGAPMRLLTIAAGGRREKRAVVTAEIGGKVDERTLGTLGLKGLRPGEARGVEVGLSREAGCVPAEGSLGERRLKLDIKRGTRAAVYVAIRARAIARDEYVLVNIVEYESDHVVGGYGYVVVAPVKDSAR